ncbi:MAG: calcium/sodium antiporter [Bacteroidaceae bacterium]|nr:calcium/sodium antiporter [Bacteroidaceae bacterium]
MFLFLKLIITLTAIIVAADWMTSGASAIAVKLRIRPMIVGLTIVAMGTSAPELFVSVSSALESDAPGKAGMVDIALGNVVGSNIFNCLLIIGLVTLIAPVSVPKKTVNEDILIVIFSSVLLSALLCTGEFSRWYGIFFLICFAWFLKKTINSAKTTREETNGSDDTVVIKQHPLWLAITLIIVGLAVLVFASDIFVDTASEIASVLGVSDKIIGLTIVGIGTSAPEIATSVMAARKGQGEMAIGNVIGSNIFNILMILGLTGVIHPLKDYTINYVDLGVMILGAFLFWLFSRTKYKLERWEGAVLLLTCTAYICWLIQST